MSHYLIRRIRLAHCARGPEVCAQCRAMDREVPALLDIDPPNYGLVARRMIQVDVGGSMGWREFDVVRTFQDEQEARRFADAHGVEDTVL